MATAPLRVIVTKEFPQAKKPYYLVLESSKRAGPALELEKGKVKWILSDTFWGYESKNHSNSVVRAASAKSISPQDFVILGEDGEATGAVLSNTQLSPSSLSLTWSKTKNKYSGSNFMRKFCFVYNEEAEALQLPDPGTTSLEPPWYEDFDDAFAVAWLSDGQIGSETLIGIEEYEAEAFPEKEENVLDAMNAGTPFFVGLALAGNAALSIKDWLTGNKGNK
ncbi:hypothetical protein CYMTET_43651 [Cymbomonas tetramitiformis]|uniref:Uncharacterized protein n=1 Tax=Cymbomonas tetramitiformis TaxID=36881 RepID=A0AAE0BV60_9CHLO|nr:hypothetical protein CYMTET_46952 [Cymbomonas tetramitiformis]KAK3246827.1 hypothetical protein CYMTET_43651 [Cymbomonas tetramitiformis]|eukprot:gene19961-23882_t